MGNLSELSPSQERLLTPFLIGKSRSCKPLLIKP
jgi:hypothetical protein